MNCYIFICTHAKDFPWLKYCLRSLDKYAKGFDEIRIVIPTQDQEQLFNQVGKTANLSTECFDKVRVRVGDEWPDKGMLWHENVIMHADDWCPDADFIAHLDPDCIFTAPVTPETYIANGKPLLRYESFAQIGARHPGVLKWKEAVEACLPFPVFYETMRCHPEVYHRGLYLRARQHINLKTHQQVADYIRSCRNEFPQSFCEFVTLGNVALHDFPDRYQPVMQTCDTVTPPNHVQQFWSHGAMDQPQNIWVNGQQTTVVPIDIIKQHGLND